MKIVSMIDDKSAVIRMAVTLMPAVLWVEYDGRVEFCIEDM
ncbi:MAG TPA: hypothetical protein PK659_10615 [Methanothrix sp.]|nr:hypothetical protein [Methanothrix sp.]HOK59227.1 hypothetical protein [Methanothrix sp.]HOL44695.1 hypothetical protein [Methanothrix sp.]